VLRAAPDCSGALRYVMVERAAPLRAAQRELLTVEPFEHALGPSRPGPEDGAPRPVGGSGPIVSALDELPALTTDGVILANELLDNLPFDLVERSASGWTEIRVGVDDAGSFHEVAVPAADDLIAWLDGLDPPAGTRLPVQRAVDEWIDDAAYRLRHGVVLLIDYATELDAPAVRDGGWLRTYRAHARGGDPLERPGSQDITSDVLLPPLRRAARRAGFTSATEADQATWLRSLGIDELVAEGRARWREGAARGDLAALAGRSRVTEAAALTDPAGLGAHTVLILSKGAGSGGR
jgi:SAM-dependent MidA family methyltransferase